jgi:hypothetical protein
MGVDLLVTYKGKIIADLGRKHLYTFEHFGSIPRSYDEIEEELKSARKQVMADVMARVGILSTLDKDDYQEVILEIVAEITDSLEYFEEECVKAGRVMTLVELEDEFNEEVEVIDDIALEIKKDQEKKDAEDKENYLDSIRVGMLENRIKELEKVDYDEVEHQTSEVDLDFVKNIEDNLIGEKWETLMCDDIKDHRASIEEIGYCSECRRIQIENDEYLDRENKN